MSFYLLGSSQIASAQTPSLIICKGSSVNYREFNTGGSEQSIAWDWTFEGGTPTTSNLRQPSIKYNTIGIYKTTCISYFPSGSQDTNSTYVRVIDGTIEPIPMNDTTICSGIISLNLRAGNDYDYNRFVWTSPDVTLNQGDTLSNLQIDKPGTYKVSISNKCASGDKTITVTKGVVPIVDLGPDRFVCRNISLSISAGSNTNNQYLWEPFGETSADIIANQAGMYKVTVTSPDGCSFTDEIMLIDSCPPVYYLPTAFTPNDAPPNDIYKPYLEGFKSMNMRIYNRWGEKVFETDDLNGGWDGIANDEPAIEGLYVVLLELIGNDGYRKMDQGTFMLLR